MLVKLGLIDKYIDFLGDPWNARLSVIAANVWRGIPFVAITLLAGLQTISPSYYEASAIDGATPWQQFRHVTLPLLTPIIAVVMTFSVLFTFTDFQLIYVHHPRRPAQRDPPDGDARRSSARSPAARWARARRSRSRWCRSCWRRSCSATSGCSAAPGSRAGRTNEQPAHGQHDRRRTPSAGESVGMSYLRDAAAQLRHDLPAAARLPVRAAVPVLLDGRSPRSSRTTSCCRAPAIRSGSSAPTLAHFDKLLFHTAYPAVAVEHGAGVGGRDLHLAGLLGVRRLRDRAAALQRLQAGGPVDLPGLPGAALDPVHSRWPRSSTSSACSTRRWALILTYPTFLIPFSHLAADGLLPLDPVRAGGMRADRRRQRAGRSSPRSSCRWRCRG